jgi:hypothetical protein
MPVTQAAATQTFPALTSNGATAQLQLPQHCDAFDIDLFLASATFGGGTLTLQLSPDFGQTWLDVPGASWTSGSANAYRGTVKLYASGRIRFNLAGATSPNVQVSARARPITGIPYQIDVVPITGNGPGQPFMLENRNDFFGWAAFGTFGGGTLALQASPNGGTSWFNVDTAGANALRHILVNVDTLYRLNLSGATAPSVSARVYR